MGPEGFTSAWNRAKWQKSALFGGIQPRAGHYGVFGCTIGAGIFVPTGRVAALTPVAGSAYTYAYATSGDPQHTGR